MGAGWLHTHQREMGLMSNERDQLPEPLSAQQQALLPVLRACDDLRRGWSVCLTGHTPGTGLLVLPLERLDAASLATFGGDALSAAEAIITGERAQTLKVAPKGQEAVRLTMPMPTAPMPHSKTGTLLGADVVADLRALADPTLDLAQPLRGPYKAAGASEAVHAHALKLVKVARLLPAVLAAEVALDTLSPDIMRLPHTSLADFDLREADTLIEVARARVPLAGAENTQLVAFRPAAGGLEHIAIVIGAPSVDAPVLMRVHSECFTGDLLASLKCDCGEQLRGAISAIEKAGGGIVLYLAQEGRGIGLISKLKAYALQDQGFDTVEANTRLGFGVDERVFAPAAEMLKHLGYKAVRLMTNNPNKIEALGRFGIEVVERVPHAFAANPHNEQYLSVKRDKTGHMLAK